MRSVFVVGFFLVALGSIIHYIPKTLTLYEDGSGELDISLPGGMSVEILSCDDDPTGVVSSMRKVCNVEDFDR